MKKNRIYYFDNLKLLLIFLVVFGHFLEIHINISENAKILWTFIYTFHMPLFIFVTGYLAKKQIEKNDYKKTYKYIMLFSIMKTLIFIIEKFILKSNSDIDIFIVNGIQWYLFATAIWLFLSIKIKKFNMRKKLIFSLILSLIIGFDPFFRDFLCLSRIIVFYPFYLLGTCIKEKDIKRIKSIKKIIAAVIMLIIILVIYYFNIDEIYKIRPILTGRNYYALLNKDIRDYGVLIRLLWYFVSSFVSILIIIVVPRKKYFFTKLGERTLSVYFWHAFIFLILKNSEIYIHVYENLILAVIFTLLLSSKIFYMPLKKILEKI